MHHKYQHKPMHQAKARLLQKKVRTKIKPSLQLLLQHNQIQQAKPILIQKKGRRKNNQSLQHPSHYSPPTKDRNCHSRKEVKLQHNQHQKIEVLCIAEPTL
jgi:hypothetical protein